MDLDENVDITEFAPVEVLRQQMQSYIIKVLRNGIEDTEKIQYYHRLAVLVEREEAKWLEMTKKDPTLDRDDVVLGQLVALFGENDELHIELTNILLHNMDEDLIIAVCRFIVALGRPSMNYLTSTDDEEAELVERMVSFVRKSEPHSPGYVYPLGVISLVLWQESTETDPGRYIASTDIPGLILKNLEAVVSAKHGMPDYEPFAPGCNCVESSQRVVLRVASVNEEVDSEEPVLDDLAVLEAGLKWHEFHYGLNILAQIGNYVDVLGPVLQTGGFDLMKFLLISNDPVFVSAAFSCLSSLFAHQKFASVFVARDGILLLLNKPCGSEQDPGYMNALASVINDLVQFPNIVEQICLLSESTVTQLLDLSIYLFQHSQEEGQKSICIFLSRVLIYKTFLDLFEKSGHLRVLMKEWKTLLNTMQGKEEEESKPENNDENSHSNNDASMEATNEPEEARQEPTVATTTTAATQEASIESNENNEDQEDEEEIEEEDDDDEVVMTNSFPPRKSTLMSYLEKMGSNSARSLIDHILLPISEYFAASAVQCASTYQRHFHGGSDSSRNNIRNGVVQTRLGNNQFSSSLNSSQNLSSSASPAPRYRATNVSYENLLKSISILLEQVRPAQLADSTTFVECGGLEMLLATIYSNFMIDFVGQTSADILTNGLKILWILSSSPAMQELIVDLQIVLPEIPIINEIGSRFRHLHGLTHHIGHHDLSRIIPVPPSIDLFSGPQNLMLRIPPHPNRDNNPNNNNNNNNNIDNSESGATNNYLDRMDLSDIRLEPVNQRLALQRRASTSSNPSGNDTNTSNNTQSADADTSSVPQAQENANNNPPLASNASDDQPATSDATSNSLPASIERRKSCFGILLQLLNKQSTKTPQSALYVLHIFSNYVCLPTHVLDSVNSERDETFVRPKFHETFRKAVKAIRANSGLSELVNMLKYREIHISTHSVQNTSTFVVSDWNMIRELVAIVLRGMTSIDNAIKQILSKKLQRWLPEILREPAPPGLEKTLASFKKEAAQLIRVFTNAPSSQLYYNTTQETSEQSMTKIEKSQIVMNTPIRYSQKELLELIFKHLSSQGLHKTANALMDEAKLNKDKLLPPVTQPQSTTKARNRRQSMLSSQIMTPNQLDYSNAPSSTPLHVVQRSSDLPLNEDGFLTTSTDTNEGLTLDTIMKQYLFEQHKNCGHPASVLPDFSLHCKHSCPAPVRHRVNPYGSNAVNLAHRLFSRQIQTQSTRSAMWRKYKFSRFAPRRKLVDESRLTSVNFFDNNTLFFGSSEGVVVKYDVNSADYVDEWECADHAIDLNISRSINRALTIREAPLTKDTPEIIKMWDLNNMHELATIPYITANWSSSGNEILGTNSFGQVALFDVSSQTEVRKYIDPSILESNMTKYMKIQVGSFSPDDHLILHNTTLWDKRQIQPVHIFDRFTSHGSHLFAPAGLEIITNTEIWDVRTFKLIRTCPSLDASYLMFSNAAEVLFAATKGSESRPSKFEVLDASTYDHISQVTLESAFASVSINPDDTQLAVVENSASGVEWGGTSWRIWDIGFTKSVEEDIEEEDNSDEIDDFESMHDLGIDGTGDEDSDSDIANMDDSVEILDDQDTDFDDEDHDEDMENDEGNFILVHGDDSNSYDDFAPVLEYDDDGNLIGGPYSEDDLNSESLLEGSEIEDPELYDGSEISHDAGENPFAEVPSDFDEESEYNVFEIPQRRQRGTRPGRGRRNESVFMELPSDEDEANELLEHHAAHEASLRQHHDEADSDSAFEFGDDSEEEAVDHRNSRNASRNARPPASRRRRRMPSQRQISRMLDLFGSLSKRTGAKRASASQTNNEASNDEEEQPQTEPTTEAQETNNRHSDHEDDDDADAIVARRYKAKKTGGKK